MNDSHLACPAWEAEMRANRVLAPGVLAGRLMAAGYVGMVVQIFSVEAGTDQVPWALSFLVERLAVHPDLRLVARPS